MSSARRAAIAHELYRTRGPREAAQRYLANQHFGSLDLSRLLLQRLDPRSGDRIVDVGCGSGQHVDALAKLDVHVGRVIGLDFSPQALVQLAVSGPRVHLVSADACMT